MPLQCAGPPLPLTGWPCRICVPTTLLHTSTRLTDTQGACRWRAHCSVVCSNGAIVQSKLPLDIPQQLMLRLSVHAGRDTGRGLGL